MTRLIAVALLTGSVVALAQAPNADLGYTDTPMLPGMPWRVHDPARPRPPKVTPGTADGSRPSDAIVLFDGADLTKWTAAKRPWTVTNGALEVVPGAGDLRTADAFGDVQLHLEWATPLDARGSGQNRGNSGVFLQGRYEVQVLDSFENLTYADGQAGAIYGQFPPLVNPARPAGQWQAYDIVFEAPRFEGDRLVRPASLTVFFNGVLVHAHRELLGPTVHRALPRYAAHPPEGPLVLQDHGERVRYRNIWIRRL